MSAKSDSALRSPNDPERSGKKTRERRAGSSDLGKALKTVYDETVREDIPDDFLDLLGKLK